MVCVDARNPHTFPPMPDEHQFELLVFSQEFSEGSYSFAIHLGGGGSECRVIAPIVRSELRIDKSIDRTVAVGVRIWHHISRKFESRSLSIALTICGGRGKFLRGRSLKIGVYRVLDLGRWK